MLATGIKFKKTKKLLTTQELTLLCEQIVLAQARAGYITEAQIKTTGAIRIGLHMKCFVVDVKRLGYNAVIASHVKSIKGYKRSNMPLWDQREEFNHIVNKIFDRWELQAHIKSGYYTVRTIKLGAIKEWECVDYLGLPAEINCTYNGRGQELSRSMTEQEAINYCESDKRIAEYKAKLKFQRKLESDLRRKVKRG